MERDLKSRVFDRLLHKSKEKLLYLLFKIVTFGRAFMQLKYRANIIIYNNLSSWFPTQKSIAVYFLSL